ncbi:hypothetical protein [Portibacter marinus]|uniref:hypothetical protein n=1 Tax=Portibacter marinus TaxID=2898660 RepID=UPI001F416727|nr:hypothetical protein [Portibacter marinus]
MKEVVKSLSILGSLILVCGHVSAQQHFVTPKKFEFTVTHSTFLYDSTFTNYQVNLPLAYQFDKLALFCKFEEKVARQSKVNMRFRLGSLDYVNYLEQKPNWHLTNTKNE